MYKADSYSDLANTYSKLNDKEQTLKYVTLAFDTYLSLDELIEGKTYYYNSPLLKGEFFNKTKVTFGGEMNATEGFMWTLQRRKSYDWLKNDAEYIRLLEEMKKKVIGYKKQ